jgi:6-bladed beta-propeller
MTTSATSKTSFRLSVLGLLFLISCGESINKSNENNGTNLSSSETPYKINLDSEQNKEQSVLLSSIGKQLVYIPLETNPHSIIGGNPHFEFTADYIFVADAPYGKLLQFDKTGKFIRQIGANGRGPGEYIAASSFCVDQHNEKIFIKSCWSKCTILEFGFDGKYIQSFDLPWESNGFLVLDSLGFVFEVADYSPSASGVIPGIRDYSYLENNLIITDFKFNPLFKVRRHLMRESNLGGSSIAFYYHNNELRFQQFGVDTLYILKVNKLEPFAVFNLGKNKMDPNIKFSGSNTEIEEKLREIEKKISIRRIAENKEFLFVSLNMGLSDSSKPTIFNKRTSQLTFLNSNKIENDIDGGLSFWPKIVSDDSILIDYASAMEIKDAKQSIPLDKLTESAIKLHEQFLIMTDNLTETSNPVIIKLK